MASYPASVKTFTSRTAGDTIQPSHVNDLQDEVNAIEAGLLNGTATLNSSNSTLAALSVTGGSTVGTLSAGASTVTTLSVSGGSTFAGAATFAGTVTITQQQACRLQHSVDQNVNNAAWTGLNWDTEVSDGSNLHSTSVNSSRVTFASSTGLFIVTGAVQWSAVSSGSLGVRIMLNDAVSQGGQVVATPINSAFQGQSVTAIVRATSTTDYVTLQVQQTSGSTNSVMGTGTAASTSFGTWFSAGRLL